MSLAVGNGPFSERPGGRFDFDPPERMRYVEDFPRRVRGSRNGVTVLDSLRVKLLTETGGQPRYCFPAEEAGGEGAPAPGIDGYVVVDFDAVDTWHEEDEQVFGHVRDPYHRIDVRPSSRLVPDLAWSYENPLHDAEPVRGLICFYHERLDLELDGVAQERPVTAWSKGS
jgi:uncharacterized protein (DUF427 family)